MVCKVNFTPHKHFPFSSMLTYSNGIWEGFRPRNAALMMQQTPGSGGVDIFGPLVSTCSWHYSMGVAFCSAYVYWQLHFPTLIPVCWASWPCLRRRLETDPIINVHGKENPWLSSDQFYQIFLESAPSCFSDPSPRSQSRNSSLSTCVTAPASSAAPLRPLCCQVLPLHSRLDELSEVCMW